MTYRGINFNGDSGMGQGYKYWCNFNKSAWWKADRLLVLAQVTGTGAYLILKSAIGKIDYNTDANNKCIIDITDIARTYDPGAAGYVNYIYLIYGTGSEPVQDWSVLLDTTAKGLINPARVVIPYHALQDNGVTIMPPDRFISPEVFGAGANFDIPIFEFRASSAWEIEELYPGDSDIFTISQPSHVLNDETCTGFYIIKNTHAQDSPYHLVKLLPQACGVLYAEVEWVSFTGARRRHIFEVRKAKTSTNDPYSLLNIANEFTEIKGREDSIVLHMDGLSLYDLWYYSDVITSSEVRVEVQGTNEKKRVQITDKSYTLPDGDNFDGKLDITINWKKYDAVTL